MEILPELQKQNSQHLQEIEFLRKIVEVYENFCSENIDDNK